MFTNLRTNKDVFAEICSSFRRQTEKEKYRSEHRKNKTVNLSKYIEKEDGTLVPKPKVIAQLRGIQPRPGGFVVNRQENKGSTVQKSFTSEFKYVDLKNEKAGHLESSVTDSLHQEPSNFDLNPIDEENIVDHFERLLLFMDVLSKSRNKINQRDAAIVIQFLKSVKTPNGQLAPNARLLVNFINHLIEEKQDYLNVEEKTEKSDETESNDSEHDEQKRHITSEFCRKMDEAKRICSAKDAYHKKKSCDKQKSTNYSMINQTKIVDACKTSNYLKTDNSMIKDHVCGKTKADETLLECKSLKIIPNNFEATPTDAINNRVQKTDGIPCAGTSDALNNMNCIGDSALCGDEIVQACHEPSSRSLSNASCSGETTGNSSVCVNTSV